jgi:hypothetical protein
MLAESGLLAGERRLNGDLDGAFLCPSGRWQMEQ